VLLPTHFSWNTLIILNNVEALDSNVESFGISCRLYATVGLKKGLSRVLGNSHARFLGERAAVMLLAYPTFNQPLYSTTESFVFSFFLPHLMGNKAN
jgi:hypothetical protein